MNRKYPNTANTELLKLKTALNTVTQWDSANPQGRMMLNTDMVSWFDAITCKIIV